MLSAQWPKLLNAPLSEVDPELEDIIEHEKNRQWKVRRCACCNSCLLVLHPVCNHILSPIILQH